MPLFLLGKMGKSVWLDCGKAIGAEKNSIIAFFMIGDLLRAKQMGLSVAELDPMEGGMVIDMIIESGNNLCEEEYCTVADQHMITFSLN